MTLRIRSSGSWVTVPDGHLRVMNGGSWVAPTALKIRNAGTWVDSLYHGYPPAPASVSVAQWFDPDFSQVRISWPQPTQGAPITGYRVRYINTSGGVVATWDVGNVLTWTLGGRSEDERFRLGVWSLNAAGESQTHVEVGVQMGHSQLTHSVTENRTRPWNDGNGGAVGFQGGLCRGESATVWVPSSVAMEWFHVVCSLSFSAAYVSGAVGPNNRQVYAVWANSGRPDLGPYTGSPWNTPSVDVWMNATALGNGGNAGWGIYIDGVGWSNRAVSTAQMLVGAFYVYGTETYSYTYTVEDRAYASSSTW